MADDSRLGEVAGTSLPRLVGGEIIDWQRSLLPFMSRFIVLMAAAFFLFSGIHLYEITKYVGAQQGEGIKILVQEELAKSSTSQQDPNVSFNNVLLLLEADALDKRYHQAEGMLISRIWSRQLAFITGMVLAFVGAVFILGKMSESVTQISGEATQFKVAISSASPGLILSVLGTILIGASLYVPAKVDVADGPAYIVHAKSNDSPISVTGPHPPSLKELRDLQLKNDSKP